MVTLPTKHRSKQKSFGSRQVIKTIATKFPECPQCIFYCARRVNPICNDCDVGEHFEERVRGLNPDRDNHFRRRERDDEE